MLSFINNISIKNKLILPIIIFIGVTFVTIQSVNYTVTFEREKESLIQRVKVLAQGVAYNLQAAILFEDKSSAQEILSAFIADRDIVRVKLYDTNEQLFANYQVSNTLIPRPTADELIDIADHQFAISEHFIFLLVPVTLDDAVIANLRVTISKQTFNSILTNIFKVAAVYLLFLVILGGILVKLVQRLIIEPMFDLNEAMQAFVERRSEQPKLVATNRDEIGDLVRAFNTMLERLQHRDNQINFTLDKLQERAARRASIRSAPGAERLHIPIGAMPKGQSADTPKSSVDNDLLLTSRRILGIKLILSSAFRLRTAPNSLPAAPSI